MCVHPQTGPVLCVYDLPRYKIDLCLFVSLVLKNVEDLDVSLGNPGLISPDKEDLSRILVREMFLIVSLSV